MPKVTFLPSGAEHEVPAGASLLEYCQENETPQDFGCTVGSCGTCCVVVEAGMENLNASSDEEMETVEMCTSEENARLGCQLKISGDVRLRPADV